MKAVQIKWFYLVVLALIWGSSFILIKKGLLALTPIQLGSLRIIFSAIFLLIVGFKSLPSIPMYKWKFIALTAFIGTFFPVFLFSFAQTEVSSSVSSILNSLTPLSTLILGGIFFGVTFKRTQIIGVVIGLCGTLLLIVNGAVNQPNQNYFYTILVIIASICYAANVNFIKKYLSDMKPLAITTGNFSVLLIPACIVLYFSNYQTIVDKVEVQNATLYIIILGVIGTGIANIIFFKLIQMSSPVFATSVTYLIPVVAFFWGLLDGEFLTPVQVFGAFIILIGVYLSSKK